MTSTEQALLYRAQLQAIDPAVEYLMTLYLSPELTPDEIRRAAAAGIIGACPTRAPHASPSLRPANGSAPHGPTAPARPRQASNRTRAA